MAITASYALIASAPAKCHSCSALTPAHAVVLPYDMICESEEDPLPYSNGAGLMAYITHLDSDLLAEMGMHYRQAHSRTVGVTYYANHCSSCNAFQGDHFLHGANGPFWPFEGAVVHLRLWNAPIQLTAIEATDPMFPLGEFEFRFEGEEKLLADSLAAAKLAKRNAKKS